MRRKSIHDKISILIVSKGDKNIFDTHQKYSCRFDTYSYTISVSKQRQGVMGL